MASRFQQPQSKGDLRRMMKQAEYEGAEEPEHLEVLEKLKNLVFSGFCGVTENGDIQRRLSCFYQSTAETMEKFSSCEATMRCSAGTVHS